MLGNCYCWCVLLLWKIVGQGLTVLAVQIFACGVVLNFFSNLSLLFLSLSRRWFSRVQDFLVSDTHCHSVPSSSKVMTSLVNKMLNFQM